MELDGTNEQVPARGERDHRGIDGGGACVRGRGGCAAVAVADSCRGDAAACRCRTSTWSMAARMPRTSWIFRSSCWRRWARRATSEAVQAGAEVYAALKARLAAAGHATGLGDEGGFAPQIARPEDVLSELVGAITDAGYEPGRNGVAIALDPAASEFYRDGVYRVAGESLSSVGHGRLLRGPGGSVPRVEHRGRPGRGRLGGLGAADRGAWIEGAAGRGRHLRHQPGHHPRRGSTRRWRTRR